ncbi:aconitate hydratase AcnA [Chitinasiproducens palmae]|uniref:aconitate hydratase AcnA n=1 Tax=Chitinasiproducens palmae TaxID=1770053 RepID=UPI000B835376
MNEQGKRIGILEVGGEQFRYASLSSLHDDYPGAVARLPKCLRVLAENVLRNLGNSDVEEADLARLLGWRAQGDDVVPVPFHPARVLMQDYTGIPTLVDLAAMRDGVTALGLDPQRVNPRIPVDLVIDHSLIVDRSGSADAITFNLAREFERNAERYRLAKWAKASLDRVRVVPPGNGILHQINIERIAQVVHCEASDGPAWLYPDTMVGTDSHSTMVNGIGVLGWGVGGIEAEAAMLGLPLIVPLRRVVGVRLTGCLSTGVTATDLVLSLTERLRAFNVVDAFVEFFGPALDRLAVADRVTIANMAPEYGSSAAFFPIDQATLDYLGTTGRDARQVARVEAYAKVQGLWREAGDAGADGECYSATIAFDLGEVVPSVAGPRRPQDRVSLADVPDNFRRAFEPRAVSRDVLSDGAVVIAAITSCTNTSNPAVMLAAGLLARRARQRGLRTRSWVKPSLTPGSRAVGEYLERSGLQQDLDAIGFQIAGYGCATCGGNSGRLSDDVEAEIAQSDIVAAAVLSGNRNFEARIHPLARANYLLSPPLVVAYALAGNVQIDLAHEPIGFGADGAPVHLRDIWPSDEEIATAVRTFVTRDAFTDAYRTLFDGSAAWRELDVPSGANFPWDPDSDYIRRPPYLDDFTETAPRVEDVRDARALVMLGDSTTTDHISPVGDIDVASAAGRFLAARGVPRSAFNAYGARRANHEVMVRGTFANIRLRNELVPGVEGGYSRFVPDGPVESVFEVAMRYRAAGTPLVVIAGKEYGTGSSRDWAAKGTRLLGVRAVIAESFERIHRSNLIMMGVLPLQFPAGTTRRSLALDGSETFDLPGLAARAVPGGTVSLTVRRADGSAVAVPLQCRLDTANEWKVWSGGGMMPHVIRQLVSQAADEDGVRSQPSQQPQHPQRSSEKTA